MPSHLSRRQQGEGLRFSAAAIPGVVAAPPATPEDKEQRQLEGAPEMKGRRIQEAISELDSVEHDARAMGRSPIHATVRALQDNIGRLLRDQDALQSEVAAVRANMVREGRIPAAA